MQQAGHQQHEPFPELHSLIVLYAGKPDFHFTIDERTPW